MKGNAVSERELIWLDRAERLMIGLCFAGAAVLAAVGAGLLLMSFWGKL